jgi:hypothetical protein
VVIQNHNPKYLLRPWRNVLAGVLVVFCKDSLRLELAKPHVASQPFFSRFRPCVKLLTRNFAVRSPKVTAELALLCSALIQTKPTFEFELRFEARESKQGTNCMRPRGFFPLAPERKRARLAKDAALVWWWVNFAIGSKSD